jgi:acetyltransferase-like isoleucine patch superfamily enzyme
MRERMGTARFDDMTANEAIEAGVLLLGPGCRVSDFALFRPADDLGAVRSIVLAARVVVGAFTIVHGGTVLGEGCRIEDHCVVGQPERGYAVRQHFAGEGAPTSLGDGSVLRAGAVVYAGTQLGGQVMIGHQTVVRSHVRVGAHSVLGHTMTIERNVRIGERVRCSPGSHITSDTVLADGVFLGAGVRTINDNGLDWKVGGGTAPLTPPRFDEGARVGSGAVILGGVRVGAHALVGAGAVVTRDVKPGAMVVGNPAAPRAKRSTPRAER